MTQKKTEDGYIWYCNSCSCEFSPDDDDVKVVGRRTANSCCVIANGGAHSLTYTTWTAIQKRRDCESHALGVTQMNIDRMEDREEIEPKTAAEKLEAFTSQGAPPTYFHAEVQKTGEELLNELFKDDNAD